MWVFGGQDDDGKLNDIWVYDIPTNQWEEIDLTNDERPMPRSGHSMALHKHYLVIFGGIFEITKEMDDCWVFNMKSKQFTQLFEDMAGRGSPMVSPGNSPIRRSMFMANKPGSDISPK